MKPAPRLIAWAFVWGFTLGTMAILTYDYLSGFG